MSDCQSTTAQPDTKAPFTFDGEQRSAYIGPYAITIIRDNPATFRVVTLNNSRRVDCYSTQFTPERLTIGTEVEQAARNFAKGVYVTLWGSLRTPAQIVADRKAARELVTA